MANHNRDHGGSKLLVISEDYMKNPSKSLKLQVSKVAPRKDTIQSYASSQKGSKLNIVKLIFFSSLALTVMIIVGQSKHSGQGKPPLFGDYEAQRHWMEITYNLPIKDWYENTTDNDLLYWGLDYPPLTAYHSYLLGVISSRLNGSWIGLHTSRGEESSSHKSFMRMTSLLSHSLSFLPPAFAFFYYLKESTINKDNLMLIFLLYPGLILMDHAHFQYNSVSLGFFLASYVLLERSKFIFGSIFFVLALNYKQMELYHALPIFVFILGRNIRRPVLDHLLSSIGRILLIGVTVIVSFAIIWYPFLSLGLPSTLQVIHRIFPFSRGLFEDKVANFWCAFGWILKIHKKLTIDQQIKLRSALILLPEEPKLAGSFLYVSATSLYSLCLKDDSPYALLPLFLYGLSLSSLSLLSLPRLLIPILSCLAELLLLPPPSLPHIYPLLSAFVSCSYFLWDVISANVLLFNISIGNIMVINGMKKKRE